jgi:glycosyltransferase involved in cell wall biosynthesis
VIPVSADADEALKKILSPSKLKLVVNGVDTDKFNRSVSQISVRKELGIEENDKVIIAAAVFRKQKRLDLWLRVAKQVLEKNPQCKLVLIGDGPEKQLLMSLASELNLGNNIIFTGLKENVRPYFAIGDIYLMTSDFEGLPVALLEAMSMGCAPIATKVGGIPEVIENANSGFLCEAGDANAIAEKVNELINNEQLLKTIQTNARKRIEENFSMKNMVKKLENIYEEILCK